MKKLAIIGIMLLVIGAIAAALAIPALAKGSHNDRTSHVCENCTEAAPWHDMQGFGGWLDEEGLESLDSSDLAPLRGQMQGIAQRLGNMKGRLQNAIPAMKQMGRRLAERSFPQQGALVKIYGVGDDEFKGITFNGDEVAVLVSDETEYHDPFNADAGFGDLAEDTIVRVTGARDNGTIKALNVFFKPEAMHRVGSRGTVADVSETSLTIIQPNGNEVTCVLTNETNIRFWEDGQTEIAVGDKMWGVGWKKDFSTENAIATRIIDFGPEAPGTAETQ